MSLPRTPPLGRLREKDWQRTVVEAAALHGWSYYHTRDSRGSTPGFPDLVLVHPDRGCMFIELKTSEGRLRPAQRAWQNLLKKSGQFAEVWRPSDWPYVLQALGGGREEE